MHIPAPQPKFDEYAKHIYALSASGYTRVPAQVTGTDLDLLRDAADRAMAAAQEKIRKGEKLKHTGGSEFYHASRCLYCWDDAFVRLLDFEPIHALATRLLNPYLLWDLSVLSALPTPGTAKAATTSWHRDYAGMMIGGHHPGYLWFFLCLDDATPENGATWVVPGSHRTTTPEEPSHGNTWAEDDLENFTSRIQVCGKAGDLLVLNPALLHSSGRNHTEKPRRLVNIGLCQANLPPLMDHWSIAGPKLQPKFSERVKKMLGAHREHLDTTWTALPEGWQTAPRA